MDALRRGREPSQPSRLFNDGSTRLSNSGKIGQHIGKNFSWAVATNDSPLWSVLMLNELHIVPGSNGGV